MKEKKKIKQKKKKKTNKKKSEHAESKGGSLQYGCGQGREVRFPQKPSAH